MPPRYRHLFLPGPTETPRFSSPQQGGGSLRLKPRDRAKHAQEIRHKIEVALAADETARVATHSEREGLYLTFYSEPDLDLAFKNLEAKKLGIRLLNVRRSLENDSITRATVYVPRVASAHFLKKVRAYENEIAPRSKDGRPKNANVIESIADVRRSVLESSFWMDEPDSLPGDYPDWVEAWLSTEDLAAIESFQQICATLYIEVAEGYLNFPERTVFLIKATRNELSSLVELSDSVAEFRSARQVTTFFIEAKNTDQDQQVREVLARLRGSIREDVAVLILDHGVNNGHPLLQPVLRDDDKHTVLPEWGTHDQHGHGTQMAGTAAYGDILELLQSSDLISLTHRVESSKILPPPPEENPKRLWGLYTAQGVSLAEIQAPNRKRVICLPVTSRTTRDRGRPSSWSGKLDELASGYDDGTRRLIVVSAGNIDDPQEWLNYPESNKTNEVHDPAQAWNALSVGVYTRKTRIVDPMLRGYLALAQADDLSPYSPTSLTWPGRKWPIKPEVLFEGGNVAKGPNGSVFDTEDLQLISTYHDPQVAQFTGFCATSAAAAQAAWMSARIQGTYPEAWPETIRGLIVHTAEWTDAQKASFLQDERKASYAQLARVCGYGVPNLERSLQCAANSLTLISQAELQPFDKHDKESRYVSRDMHLYRLPWPSDVLRDLGETVVRMRVTLSYFVEPSPGEVGWQDRYRYASHALRFELNGPDESENAFVQRVNAKARDDDEHPGTSGPGDRWCIGEYRNVGSIHSDIWTGTAVELSASNKLAVHPAVGWWRERHHLGRWNRKARYSLLVSIHLPGHEIDIYTPVATQIGITQPIQIAM